MMAKLTISLGLLVFVLAGTTVYGQGVQTGVLAGKVVDATGDVLPGVTVTVESPALQGQRTTQTDSNGAYSVRGNLRRTSTSGPPVVHSRKTSCGSSMPGAART